MKRYFGNKMSIGAQMVVVLKAFVEHCLSLVHGHPFDFSGLDVSQTDVFHQFLLVFCDSESCSSSFCYQMVVRETENRQQRQTFYFNFSGEKNYGDSRDVSGLSAAEIWGTFRRPQFSVIERIG